jgi:hypothetical protein
MQSHSAEPVDINVQVVSNKKGKNVVLALSNIKVPDIMLLLPYSFL